MSDHHPSRRAQQLYQLVQQQARRVLTQPNEYPPAEGDAAGGALLYLGNVHDAVPRGLLYDPLLEPVEQMVWQAIRIHAGQHGAARFPTTADLQPITKCGRVRLSWAIHILRLTRWVSISPVRDERGHVRGRVYALHDERAELADAMLLDPRYVEIVQRYCTHRNPRVAAVAREVRKELGLWVAGELEYEPEVGAEGTHRLGRRVVDLEQRVTQGARQTGFGAAPAPAKPKVQNMDLGFLPAEKPKVHNLNLGFSGIQKPKVQNVDLGFGSQAKVHNLDLGPIPPLSSSCSSKEKNTSLTTTTTNPIDQGECAGGREPLAWSARIAELLDENTQRLMTDMANSLPDGLGQTVLDELAGLMASKQARGETIDNPVSYVRAVLMAAKRGQFLATNNAQVGRDERLGIVRPTVLNTPAGTGTAKSSIMKNLTDRSWAEGLK